jgi:hypothetical protein
VIDFRYHLVSIVAVFLALAVGLLLGATQLKPLTQTALDNQSNVEKHQINSLRAENKTLQDEVGSDQQFAQAAAARLLDGLLTDQRVVLVTAPGADSATISGVTTALQQAGAKVTGQLALQPKFFGTTTSTENSLSTLAQDLAPAGVVPGSSQTAQLAGNPKVTGQAEAAQVLAAALVATGTPDTPSAPGSQNAAGLPSAQSGADLPQTQVSEILDGFAGQGYLQVSPSGGAAALEQATLAVVIIPSTPPQDGDSDPANLALISFAYQLRLASRGVVLAGPLSATGAGSAIDELINGNTGIQLSSVDDADSEPGQIMVVQALANLLDGQRPAAYGVGPGAVPSPAPVPSPSPSDSPSPTPSKSAAKSKSSG